MIIKSKECLHHTHTSTYTLMKLSLASYISPNIYWITTYVKSFFSPTPKHTHMHTHTCTHTHHAEPRRSSSPADSEPGCRDSDGHSAPPGCHHQGEHWVRKDYTGATVHPRQHDSQSERSRLQYRRHTGGYSVLVLHVQSCV